jgi:predicted MFS family arabinose efflux permease
MTASPPMKSRALQFVLMVGIMSFFADFTYEASRSIIGPYLAVLGTSAAAVAIVTGFGELLGYGRRLVSGRLADKTNQFWAITIFGYVVQMCAVPLLALAGNWPVAAALIILERVALVGIGLWGARDGRPRIHRARGGRADGPGAAARVRLRTVHRRLRRVLVPG